MTVLGLVGTGLIGGSVALAARKYKTVNKIVGLDRTNIWRLRCGSGQSVQLVGVY